MGEGNLQETKIFQGTEEEFVRAVKGFYPEAQGAYLRVSEANTVSVDLGWGLVSRHPLRFQHTGIIHARPLPDNKTGLSIRASEQNWPTINEKVWWPLLERLILDGWILPKGGNAEEHPADDLGIFDVEITELTDYIEEILTNAQLDKYFAPKPYIRHGARDFVAGFWVTKISQDMYGIFLSKHNLDILPRIMPDSRTMHEIGFIAIRKYRGKYLVRTHLNRDEARPIIKFLYRELVEYLKVKLVKAFGPDDDRQSIEQSDSTITPDVRQGDFELPKPGSKITQVLAIMEPGTIVTHVMGLVEYEPNETRLSLVRELNEILKNPIPEELTNNPDTWGKFGEMTYGELVTQSVWAAKVCEAIIDDDSDRVVEIIDKLHPYVKQQLLIVLPQIASHRGVRQGGIFSTSEGWLKAIIAAAGVPKDKITSWIDNFALSGADIATALQLPSPPRPNNENQIEALEQKPDSEDPTMVDSREQNEGTTSINERGMKLGTSERVNEFHRLVKEGYSHRKAKKSAHCDPSTYYRWCKEATGEDPIKPYR